MKYSILTHDLLDILVMPTSLPDLSPAAQSRVVHQARECGLLGYLEARIELDLCEGRLVDQLLAARVNANFYDTRMRWETRCLEEVLGDLDGPVILLKGAAYRALDMGLAQGRLASDVDLLLPKKQLPAAEALLKGAGWEAMKDDEYDQHYYREWMHELPPLQHQDRGTVVDLHHNILPPTARLKPDAGKLLKQAVQIPGSALYSLSPVDTLLHRCAHLFVDGDLHNSLRELVDINGMLVLYGERDDFGEALVDRARELQLAIPLYYAIHFCQKLLCFDSPQLEHWLVKLKYDTGIGQVFNCFLIERQLIPLDPGQSAWIQGFSAWLLFLRSHWLRMPAGMLAKHLLRQTWRRGGLKTGG